MVYFNFFGSRKQFDFEKIALSRRRVGGYSSAGFGGGTKKRRKKIAMVQPCTIAIPQVGQHNKTKSRQGCSGILPRIFGSATVGIIGIGLGKQGT
jgi:hypothetical protein